MTAPLNLVLLNAKKSERLTEEKRRLIAKVVPLCIAYNLHLVLANFEIKDTPIKFAERMADATSIGNKGRKFIELAKKGYVQIEKLPLSSNLGESIICTSEPDKKKEIELKDVTRIVNEKKTALVFGISQNRIMKKIVNNSKWHFDVSKKNIELSLDTEIGAVISLVSRFRRV